MTDKPTADTTPSDQQGPSNANEQKPADPRLEEIYRRIAKGDTSVVSEVYWIQMLD